MVVCSWCTVLLVAGIDATLATVFAWPLAALQNGVLRSMFTDAGIDIYNIDGYLDGILSHKYAQTRPACGEGTVKLHVLAAGT